VAIEARDDVGVCACGVHGIAGGARLRTAYFGDAHREVVAVNAGTGRVDAPRGTRAIEQRQPRKRCGVGGHSHDPHAASAVLEECACAIRKVAVVDRAAVPRLELSVGLDRHRDAQRTAPCNAHEARDVSAQRRDAAA
jgi:hypothetical protein